MDAITVAVLATALLSASIGFMACAVLVSNRLRRQNIDTWREARDYYTQLYTTPKP